MFNRTNDNKIASREADLKSREFIIQYKEERFEKDILLRIEKETLELQIENNKLKSKAEVLENAFESLGFDVKDMKDILNKLVDGIVSKNEIKVIK